MRVLLFGGSGMIGQGVLRECLARPEVTRIISVGRTPLEQKHEKLEELFARTSSTGAAPKHSAPASTRCSSAWAFRQVA